MKINEVPTEFEWVKARAACSAYQMFKKLQLGAQLDADARSAQIDRNKNDIRFIIVTVRGARFSVTREEFVDLGHPVRSSVDFHCEVDKITVSRDGTTLFSIAVALNDAGRCICKVEEQELEEWQVRRRAMEPLLFQFPAIP